MSDQNKTTKRCRDCGGRGYTESLTGMHLRCVCSYPDEPPPTTAPDAFLLEVWAEEPDTRVRIEPWGDGVILTVITPWLPNPIVTSIAGYRWKRILAALKEVPGHD